MVTNLRKGAAHHSSQKSRNIENKERCVDAHSSSKYRTMVNSSPAEDSACAGFPLL